MRNFATITPVGAADRLRPAKVPGDMPNGAELNDRPILALRGITKAFPGCLANDHVDLTVGRNEIHALLGENGAGKSTLVKIIYGVMKPDAGDIFWQGEQVVVQNPAHARRLGIGMVFQHFSLFEALTVTENVALGMNEPGDRVGLRDRITAISHSYGLPLDPDQSVHDLSVGERQRIEIVRCLVQKPKLLIMDEPTSVLTPQEVEKLFRTLRRLASEGCSILYISHKLEEIRALCDTATIMRLGRVVAQCTPREKTARALAELMLNAELAAPSERCASAAAGTTPRLAVDRLTLRSSHAFGTNLKEVSFAVAGGEILGIAGIAGNGQTELMEALSGEALAGNPGTVRLDGVAAGHMDPRARRKLGGCFVPEDRYGHGAVTTMTLAENVFLSAYLRRSLARLGLIRAARTVAFTRDIIARFDVRTTGPKAEARALSGGNLQKFLVGREVLYIRRHVPESPSWNRAAARRGGTLAILRSHWRLGLYVVALMTAFNFFSHGTQDLYPTFLEVQHHLSPQAVGTIAAIYNVGAIVGGIVCGALSEWIGRRRMMVIAALLSLPVLPLWAFAQSPALLATGAFLMQVMVQGAWGVIPVHLNELSPDEARGTFPGFAYQLGNLLASVNATLQAGIAVHFGNDYGLALALVAGTVAVVIAVLAAFGIEAKGVAFGTARSPPVAT